MSCCDKKNHSDKQVSGSQADHNESKPWWRSGHNLMMVGCVAIMGYVIFSSGPEKTSWFSYLLLLACPLMHLWMMKAGVGCHDDKKHSKEAMTKEKPEAGPLPDTDTDGRAGDSVKALQPARVDVAKPQQIRREF
ncbi:DUF2933 domain-containing protein [Motiliproteus sp. MSK22-1]|uniref:DUF2933 domain-containing protein n=1 Tax=Motiliproteus sp. MSK22-1 TaxID=1897630 RepID=UPI00097587FF|nr:DUF2933 domain-containing protein [Motiliproteus sp. MSK22-1]OMH31758.1 hypothetical protein BGP75_16705 [Motiliproteus sp. MSK22-1]